MTTLSTKVETARSLQRTRWQRIAPVITLVLLATLIPEVLSGSIRITTLFALIPATGVWGCGALIIRYLARKGHKDWLSIFLMGLALALAEECIIQQTSLAPLVGIDPAHVYSRAFGVNWLYLLWALGYESIWVVVIPIQLTELIFPAQSDDPWIGRRGLIIASMIFVLASLNAWYFWTQMFVPKFFPASAYQPPLTTIIPALAIIAILVSLALIRRPASGEKQKKIQPAPRPLLVGSVSFILGLFWFLFILVAYGAVPTLPVVIPLGSGLIVAGLVYFLFKLWSNCSGWHDAHRFALVAGVVLATGLGGFIVLTADVVFTMSHVALIDRLGQLGFSVIAILLLISLARRPQFRRHETD